MEPESVYTFFKKNVGEEDVIKLLLLSAGKSLISVAIVIGALLAFAKLTEQYGLGFSCLFTFITIIFTTISVFVTMGWSIKSPNTFQLFKPSTWNLLPMNKFLYFDGDELIDKGSKYINYIIAWSLSIGLIISIFIIGIISIGIYAITISLFSSLDIPSGFLYTAIPCTISFLGMSALFLKLKWKKLWLDGFNWNLAAWCICASIIITMISFVAGVAIRRIAGFIGIEYTAILVISYIIITAVYVYLDLKQWISNKSREIMATQSKTAEIMSSDT